jgi:hypothetical protein
VQLTIAITVFMVLLSGSVFAQVSIPLRTDGYGVGGPTDADVVVEMFLDLLCPGSQAAWPAVL